MKKAANKRRKVGKTERAMKATMYQCVAVVDKLIGKPKVNEKPYIKRKKRYISMQQHMQEMKIAKLEAENALLMRIAMEAKVRQQNEPQVVNNFAQGSCTFGAGSTMNGNVRLGK